MNSNQHDEMDNDSLNGRSESTSVTCDDSDSDMTCLDSPILRPLLPVNNNCNYKSSNNNLVVTENVVQEGTKSLHMNILKDVNDRTKDHDKSNKVYAINKHEFSEPPPPQVNKSSHTQQQSCYVVYIYNNIYMYNIYI